MCKFATLTYKHKKKEKKKTPNTVQNCAAAAARVDQSPAHAHSILCLTKCFVMQSVFILAKKIQEHILK